MSLPATELPGLDDLDILVVDDDQLTLEIAAWILNKSGCRYRLCSDPFKALDELAIRLPRILIVDYFMPSINGIEFLDRFRRLPEAHRCQFYLCSAIEPMAEQIEQLKALNGRLLPKDSLSDSNALLGLL